LKFKSVFHVVFTSQDAKAFFKLIHACLQRAEDLQYSSIAFPAIGTGIRGYPAPEAAKGMKEAIKSFLVGILLSLHRYVLFFFSNKFIRHL